MLHCLAQRATQHLRSLERYYMSKGVRVPQEMVERAVSLKNQGLSYRQVGEQLGWSLSWTHRVITRAQGRSMRPSDPKIVQEAMELRGLGWSYRRIGDKLGIHPSSVYFVVNKSRINAELGKKHWRLVTPEKFSKTKELLKLGVARPLVAKIVDLGLGSIYVIEKSASFGQYRTTTNSRLQKVFADKPVQPQATQLELPTQRQPATDVALITRDEWESNKKMANKKMVRFIYEKLGGN